MAGRIQLAGETGLAGHPDEALRAAAESVVDTARAVGEEDSLTLFARYQVALWTGLVGDTAKATALFDTLLSDSDRILGPDDEFTLDVRDQLDRAPDFEPGYHLPPAW